LSLPAKAERANHVYRNPSKELRKQTGDILEGAAAVGAGMDRAHVLRCHHFNEKKPDPLSPQNPHDRKVAYGS
jgi:hypothetical protein